jgi:chemotaxis signal transduction protein
VNYHGELLPVVSMKSVFNIQGSSEITHDFLILITTRSMRYAMWVTELIDVVELEPSELKMAKKILVEAHYIKGIFELNDSTVLLFDPESLFTSEQIALLKKATSGKHNDHSASILNQDNLC